MVRHVSERRKWSRPFSLCLCSYKFRIVRFVAASSPFVFLQINNTWPLMGVEAPRATSVPTLTLFTTPSSSVYAISTLDGTLCFSLNDLTALDRVYIADFCGGCLRKKWSFHGPPWLCCPLVALRTNEWDRWWCIVFILRWEEAKLFYQSDQQMHSYSSILRLDSMRFDPCELGHYVTL